VHVRRGDYDGIYHLRLGKAYYDAAMATLRVTVEQCIFFTDDAQAVAEMYPGAAIAQGDTMQDLYSMTECGRHIISWWGAWLANAWNAPATGAASAFSARPPRGKGEPRASRGGLYDGESRAVARSPAQV
jgi:hypothetical protein